MQLLNSFGRNNVSYKCNNFLISLNLQIDENHMSLEVILFPW